MKQEKHFNNQPFTMKKTISYLCLLFTLLSIGCQSHTVQTTSGREYLSSYAPTNQSKAKIDGEEELFPSTDREVREVANIEPSLHFPGKGVGKILMNHAMEEARSLGAKSLDLTSRPSREAANKLYQAIGFQERETNVYRYSTS
jgi:hypothetical protein